MRLRFRGHYNEPLLDIKHTLAPKGAVTTLYRLSYNPLTGIWAVDKPQTIDGAVLPAPAQDAPKKAEFKPALPPVPTKPSCAAP